MKAGNFISVGLSVTIGLLSTLSGNAQTQTKFKNQTSKRIVNGSDVFIEDHPYQVDLGGCGGAILGARWIITAEHCIKGDGSNITVRAGITKKSEFYTGQTVKVKRAILNPNSNSDMALLELETPLDLSGDFAKAITYASPLVFNEGLVAKDKLCTSTGWGMTDPNISNSSPDHLQGAVLKFGNVALSDDRIRVEEYQERMACRGDSGGPLVVDSVDKSKFILVGTVSGGEGDPCSDYGFWGNVAKASSWIESQTGIKPYNGNTVLSSNDYTTKEGATFNIWPNPATGVINIDSGEPINEIKIYSILGEEVLSTEGSNKIDISQLTSGTYIIQDTDSLKSGLFIIEK
ncbi:trypsin-like serine protease [Aquimarina agarilytica]|uniref:trypsin-like serine protease n=1 Tax=Aquimarina agarilytica TaxID=1087449 RepID=UPI0002897D32|nr:trypsin-like serine protease [Aquimarina agarilytica]